jgi:hypothetical protein
MVLPMACSSGGEFNRAVEGDKAVPPANETMATGSATAGGTAQSENAPATAATADCPYATRNFHAVVRPTEAPNTGQDLEIAWESSLDDKHRLAEFDVVEKTPLVVIELRPGTMTISPEYPEWTQPGSVATHNAANTHAVLRCGGREIARVAIPRP